MQSRLPPCLARPAHLLACEPPCLPAQPAALQLTCLPGRQHAMKSCSAGSSPSNPLPVFQLADSIAHRVIAYGIDGTFIRQWGMQGTLEGQLFRPCGLGLDSSRQTLYVSTQCGRRCCPALGVAALPVCTALHSWNLQRPVLHLACCAAGPPKRLPHACLAAGPHHSLPSFIL